MRWSATKAFCCLLVFVVSAGVALAQPVLLWACNLDGSQEVPPVTTDGVASASGTYDPATNELRVEGMFAAQLSSRIVASHIHRGAAGSNGGVFVDFGRFGTWSFDSFWSYQQTAQILIPDAEEAGLLAGNTYINIHTERNSGGEVRGQIEIVGLRTWPTEYAITRGSLVGDGAVRRLRADEDEYIVVRQRFQASPRTPNTELVAKLPVADVRATAGTLSVRVKSSANPLSDPTCIQQIAIRNVNTGSFEVVDQDKPVNPAVDEGLFVVGLDDTDLAKYIGTGGVVEVAVRVFHGAPVSPGWTMSIDQIELELYR